MPSGHSQASDDVERARALRERANDQRGEVAALAEKVAALTNRQEAIEPAVS